MAIYKPSNLYPNLQEIDLEQDNTFTCQVNTSGSSVKAYQIRILSDKNESLYESTCKNLAIPVKNKSFLQVTGVTNSLNSSLVNGKDYKWGIRTYNAVKDSTAQPSTVVCSGFLVGSTKYVIWTGNNEKIEQDRWIEFDTTGSANMMPILAPNDENLVLPNSGEQYRERQQISWVTTDLGFNKDITKIETNESFKYNYINGTSFKLYQCSDKHGYNNIFVDPNDGIELSYWIILYANQTNADAAKTAGETPATTGSTYVKETARKIVGYSSDTGEIRVQEAFSAIPVNGNVYRLFKYDSSTTTYTEVTSDISQVVGGAAITDASFVIKTNQWNATTKQLFIQPNINIKSDATNPDEIVFDNAGERVDIIQAKSTTLVPGKTIDITIDKLDNTQWLLTSISSSSATIPVIPKSTYTVYTDFMDASPDCIFYARKNPNLTMQLKNFNNSSESFSNISTANSYPYRDISFYTIWNSPNNTQIKYYKYVLYDKDGVQITESKNYYDTDMAWKFRGFESSDSPLVPQDYSIKVIVVDEFGKGFSQISAFKIYYETEEGVVPLAVDLDCNTMSNTITISVPIYLETTSTVDKTTVTYDDVGETDVVEIKSNQVLNYTKIAGEGFTPFSIPPSTTFLSQFQITGGFLDTIPENGEQTVLQWGKKNKSGTIDVFTLKLSSFLAYYVTSNDIIMKNTDQFKLKLYKNDSSTPLTCFNGNTVDYFDVSMEDARKEFRAPEYISCMLQDSTNFRFLSRLTPHPETGLKYVLTQNDGVYTEGIYTWNISSGTGKWVADYSTDYIFVDNLSQVPGYTYETFKVPENCRDANGNIIWTDSGNAWIDIVDYCMAINKNVLNRKWFMFYCVIDNTGANEVVTCYMSINDERSV